MKQVIQIKKPIDIFPLMKKWKKSPVENFLTITLNSNLEVIKIHHVTKGIVGKTIIHPRECFVPAIRDYAFSVIFVHNHNNSNAKPSLEDNNITTRLCMVGELLGIIVQDHIIITPHDDYYSYRKEKKIKDNFSVGKQKYLLEQLAAEVPSC
jgi:DNA repair protein RadC